MDDMWPERLGAQIRETQRMERAVREHEQRIRAAALEEAAKACESLRKVGNCDQYDGCDECAKAIRDLISKE